MKEHKVISIEFDYDPEGKDVISSLGIKDADYQMRIGKYLIKSEENDTMKDFFKMREENLISDAEVMALICGGIMVSYKFARFAVRS